MLSVADNAYDVQAKELRIDVVRDSFGTSVTFTDNGPGMKADELYRMLRQVTCLHKSFHSVAFLCMPPVNNWQLEWFIVRLGSMYVITRTTEISTTFLS
jgi:hypothetical protein